MSEKYPVEGAGLGLRRALLKPLESQSPEQIGFMEVAPENWIGVGGRLGKRFRAFTEKYPFVCHGLSLSIGGTEPIDIEFVKQVRAFLDQHNMSVYSDHLTYCSDEGHLYDLMPIPFTADAVRHVAGRIRQVEDILERPLVIENASYYAAPGQEMTEIEFINAVLEEADCGLLLDVNNIYVNSINHRYDAEEFLTALPANRVVYFHVAGHFVEAEDLRVDTHAAEVIDPVWQLLDKAYAHCGVVPTLLERDFNIPPLADLLSEMDVIIELQKKWSRPSARVSHG